MAAPDEKLHGKQAAAIAALLAHRTIAEAAHRVGIGERTHKPRQSIRYASAEIN